MKTKLIIFLAAWLMCGQAYGAQVLLKTDAGPGQTRSVNTELGVANSNFTELYNQAATHWVSDGRTYTASIDSVTHGGKIYICTTTHNSSAAGVAGNEPGVGGNWQDVWKKVPDALVADTDYLTPGTASTTYQPLLTNPIIAAGAQDITGVKNFTVSPLVPTPTTDNQAANRKFVLDNAASVTGATIDDTAGSGDTDVVYSAGKVVDTFQPISGMEYVAVDNRTIVIKSGDGEIDTPNVLGVPDNYFQAYDVTLINKAAIDTQSKFETLVGWLLPTGGSTLIDGGSVLIDCGDSLSANGADVIDGGAAI